MIVTNPLGGYVEPRTFKDYYGQILTLADLPHFTFHALRHTFASRAVEQGMDMKTLSTILGHYSVAFTMDTYAHVLDDHKRDSMALMEDLYTAAQSPIQEFSYPVIMIPREDGALLFTVPDFPDVQFCGTDVQQGLQYIKERLEEEVLTALYPPIPTPANQIALAAGQFLMQIPV